jgi:hypothetical protein
LSGRRPDIAREVEGFLNGFELLIRLPLISDGELNGLFSAGLLHSLEEINQYNKAERICANCSDRCCGLIKCELYHPDFGTCPAFNLRPLLCRMHYCHKFDFFREEVKIIGDIFLECLLAAQQKDRRKTGLFDSPPLGPAAPALAAKILPLTAAFKEGRLDKTMALSAIQAEVKEYRLSERD